MTKINTQKAEASRIVDTGNFPKVILIDTISFCNLRCSMCGHKDMKRPRGFMDEALYKKIIDEIAAKDKNVRVWLVFFGEVLMLRNRNLFELIKYAKDKGLTDVVINSNGNLLDEKTARGLIKAGLDAIYVGIDAFDSETYSHLRVGGDYNTVVENVKGLIRLKKEMRASKPAVFAQFVEMDENSSQVEGFKRFWTSEGAEVKIRPKVSWAGLVEATNLTIPQAERWPCYWAMQTMSIADDGSVVMCAVDVDARFVAGNVNDQSLEEIWMGTLKDVRNKHLDGKFSQLPFPCNDCLDWQSARADFYRQGEE